MVLTDDETSSSYAIRAARPDLLRRIHQACSGNRSSNLLALEIIHYWSSMRKCRRQKLVEWSGALDSFVTYLGYINALYSVCICWLWGTSLYWPYKGEERAFSQMHWVAMFHYSDCTLYLACYTTDLSRMVSKAMVKKISACQAQQCMTACWLNMER